MFGILLALYTELRIGELLALTREDVDLQKETLSITKSCYDKWEAHRYIKAIDTTKTKSSEHMIPLPRRIIVYMKALKKQTNSRYVVVGKTEWGAQVYQRAFKRLLKKLNIRHRNFHALHPRRGQRQIQPCVQVRGGKPVKIKELREHFYERGLCVDGILYVRYKRSAGSSREGKCLFIDERLSRAMDGANAA